ncbi:facilitated trehalose transporter Tret1-like [Macrosteles quadrilineatus]|uniref:facilitated trehalose transporter Tret1-like n=1 Tax=Macrosteles quadrilineatus TaxID=74068 RepID=UPI0023E114AD|nr:facilitated trehalose transporter Tret1-like [Macrosteles quadrilineatus]
MKISLPGPKGNLYFSAFAANLASTSVGTHYSWSSPTIPKLQASDSWLLLNDEEASWVGSLTALGTVAGPFLGGWLMDHVGRRRSIILSVVISLVAWLVLLTAESLWQLYVGRVIGGIGGGIAFLVCPVYVAEIAEPDVRGALGSMFAFFLVGGYLIEYSFGPYVTYSTLIWLNCIPAILFFLLFSLTPESPYYFLRKNDYASASDSLTWLRSGRKEEEVQKEINEIQTEVRRSMEEKAHLSDLVATRGNRMGLLLACGMVAGQQISGVNAVLFYGQSIFIMAGTSFSSSVSTLILGIMLFVAGGFAIPFSRYFGMKKMFIFSAVGMAIFQAILGVYFYLMSSGHDMSAYGYVPVTSLVLFIFCYTMGFGPLPWAVMAEVFPSNVKALAAAITASFCWLLGFVITKFFNSVSDHLGAHFAFFIFSACCVAALLFTIFVLPDTRGLTLQEILDLLNKTPLVSSQHKHAEDQAETVS